MEAAWLCYPRGALVQSSRLAVLRAVCRDIEFACDEKVIKKLDNEQRADYMQALLSCSVSRSRFNACPLAFGEVGIKERVKTVMNYRNRQFG